MQPKQMKKRISAEYPESRYAQIMNNTTANAASLTETPSTYTKWYKLYEQEQFVTVLENSDALISQFSGDEIVSKLNCLKQTLRKIERIIRLKNALQLVADVSQQ
jgi:thiaminase